MNVVMFTNTYVPHVGGVARSVSGFVEDLKEAGHRVLVVAPTFPDAEDSTEDVVRVPAIQNFNGSDFSVRLPIPGLLTARLDRFQPDIIHSHHPFLLGDTALRIARQRGLPLVFTHHTLYERYVHYVPFNAESMKKFTVELTTQYANLCDMVLAPSESIRELLSERQVETRMEVLPTGVDIEHFSNGTEKSVRKEFEIPSSAPVLGHVGRLAKEKNLDYLTAAVCRVLAARSDVWFVVVGDGSFAETMKSITREKGVHERLAMLGTRSGKELVDAYAAMDVFVFASTSETQGLVLTEAMAAGTPVIALDASGVRDVVEDEVNGRLLPQDTSPKHFADAIVKALSKEYAHALDQWEQNARRTAQLYSRQRCCEKLISIYQRLMNEQKSTNDHGRSDTWERVLNGIKAEWELLLSKGNAAWTATSEE